MTDYSFAPWDDPTAAPLVHIRKLTKRFGDFVALDRIDLDIYPKEFFALIGASGCGKTTLMRILAGFETPSSGAVFLNNHDLVPIPPHQRNINMMFQSYALFPHMNVADNIAFGLKQDKMSKTDIAERVEEMLTLVQLGKFARRKPHQLSGGQRQRVALARALAKKPQLLLLDEPLAALDKKLRQETQFELVDIQESLGLTFVIVTHDQEEAMIVASRIAVMQEGRIAQVDPPSTIYENPKSLYVADFLGEINLIAGYAAPIDSEYSSLQWAEGEAALRIHHPLEDSGGHKATLALRPEKILISDDKPNSESCRIRGTITDIAYTGNLSIYCITLSNGLILKAQETNHRRLAHRRHSWNQEVWLSWRATAGSLLIDKPHA